MTDPDATHWQPVFSRDLEIDALESVRRHLAVPTASEALRHSLRILDVLVSLDKTHKLARYNGRITVFDVLAPKLPGGFDAGPKSDSPLRWTVKAEAEDVARTERIQDWLGATSARAVWRFAAVTVARVLEISELWAVPPKGGGSKLVVL